MAEWSYGVNDAATVKLYSHRIFKQSITKTIAFRLAQISSSVESEDNIVQILDDTAKNRGDQITYDLISKLSGDGQIGDDELAGNEEAPQTFTASLLINQLRHAVLLRGAVSQQRVPINMRDTAKVRLGDWFAEKLNYGVVNQATGNTNQANLRYTGLNATVAPDAPHHVFSSVDHTTEATLDADDGMNVAAILTAVYRAHTLKYPIKPIQLKGLEVNGVLLLHPLQVLSLKTNYSAGQWGDIQRAAMQGGQITGNPINESEGRLAA